MNGITFHLVISALIFSLGVYCLDQSIRYNYDTSKMEYYIVMVFGLLWLPFYKLVMKVADKLK